MKIKVKSLPKALSGLEVRLDPGLGQNYKAMPWPGGPAKLSADDASIRGVLPPVPWEMANLEAEKGEVIETPGPGGIPSVFTVGGKRHSKGGTPLKLAEKSFVFSDTGSMKIKDPIILAQFGMAIKKGGYTPAEIATKYKTDKYQKILRTPESDSRQKETAEMMIANYNLKLAKLALIQESLKGFPDGIPEVAMPYIEQMQIDPTEFFGEAEQPAQSNDQFRFGGGFYQNGSQVNIDPTIPSYWNSPYGVNDFNASPINNIMMNEQAGQAQGKPGDPTYKTTDVTGKFTKKYDPAAKFEMFDAGINAATSIFNMDERLAAEKARDKMYSSDYQFQSIAGNRGDWDQFGNFRPDSKVPVQFSGAGATPWHMREGGSVKVRIKALPQVQKGDKFSEPEPVKDYDALDEFLKNDKYEAYAQKYAQWVLRKSQWEEEQNAKGELGTKSVPKSTPPVTNSNPDKKSTVVPSKSSGTKSSGVNTITSVPYGDLYNFVNDNLVEGSAPLMDPKQVIGHQSIDKKTGLAGGLSKIDNWKKSNPDFFKYWKDKYGDKEIDVKDKSQMKEYEEFYNKNTHDKVYNRALELGRKKGLSDSDNEAQAIKLADAAVKELGFDFTYDPVKNPTVRGADQTFGKWHDSRRELQFGDLDKLSTETKKSGEEDSKPGTTQSGIPPATPAGPAPWWLQDIIKTWGALGDFYRVKKYNPWQAAPNVYTPDVTFYDPERELEANSEMVNQGVQGLSAFASPQGYTAGFSAMQGEGAKNAANILAKYNNLNVGVANQHAASEADSLTNYSGIKAGLDTSLYDKYTIANQQFDNAKNMARQNIRQSYMDAVTNRAYTQALNTAFENYQVDPSTGGMVWMPHGRPIKPTGTGADNMDKLRTMMNENPWLAQYPGAMDAVTKYALGDMSAASPNTYDWEKAAIMQGGYPM